jgi:hypothetical protein
VAIREDHTIRGNTVIGGCPTGRKRYGGSSHGGGGSRGDGDGGGD